MNEFVAMRGEVLVAMVETKGGKAAIRRDKLDIMDEGRN